MNRKIQFRGFNLKNKQWIYGYYLVNRGKHYIVKDEVVEPFVEESDFEVEPESVGQFVGVVGGIELYEGDIANFVYGDNLLNLHGTVAWDDIYCQFKLRPGDYGGHLISTAVDLFKCVIHGNEYEKKLSNP